MLVERLMKLAPDGSPAVEGATDHISVHTFFAAVGEVVAGRLTSAQVKATWNIPDGDTDYSHLAAQLPAASLKGERALYLEGIHGVFMLAEVRFSGYATPAEVRAKLGI